MREAQTVAREDAPHANEREEERFALWDFEVGPGDGGVAGLAVGGGEGLVVVHAAAGAVGDALGGDAAEHFHAAADGEAGVRGVQLADALVGAVPGGAGA